jgi:hypothetical protein
MNIRSILHISGGLAALALLTAVVAPHMAAQTADSEEISKLFLEAKSHATLAEHDAAVLESYTHSRIARKSHAARLNVIKEHVNDLGKVARQLSDRKDQGSPWQQEAINQIDPLLRGMADQLTATIKHLNENQGRTSFAPYHDYVEANHDLAGKTAELMSDIVEYDRSNAKARLIEQRLQLPAGKSE